MMLTSQVDDKDSLYGWRVRPSKHDHMTFDHMMLALFMIKLLLLQSMCFQHKAVMVCERVLGVDHPDTVAAYVSVSFS